MRIGQRDSHSRRSGHRGLLPAAIGLLLLAAGSAGLLGCESKPAEPVYDNVFDPDGPWSGDPLQIACTATDTFISVTWNQPQGYGIATYAVNVSDQSGSGYELIEEVAATSTTRRTYPYYPVDPTRNYWFKVTAFNEDGEYLLGSLQSPSLASTGPLVQLGDGSHATATRFLDILVTVTAGDSIRIADNSSFSGARTFAVPDGFATLATNWDLGDADSSSAYWWFSVQSFGSDFVSAVRRDSIGVEFAPELVFDDDAPTTATRTIALEASTNGVEQLRLAASAEDLETAAWLDYTPANSTWTLEDDLSDQTVHAQFRSDFGLDSEPVVLTIAGDPLTDVSVAVDLDGATADPLVDLLCSAVATQVRVGEGTTFATAPWRAYADTVSYTVTAGSGRKTLYVQYRNDFTDSEILTAALDYVAQPLAVGFSAPLPDQRLVGGVAQPVAGWVSALAGEAAIDSVKVNLPDGQGWITPSGIADWETTWEVPDVATSTALLLRARAWAGGDSVTTQVDVIVDPAPAAD